MADRQIRVLHVIETLGRGGAEQLLATLLPALPAEGVTPIVAVARGPFDLQPALEGHGIQVIRLPEFHKWNLVAGMRVLRDICAAERIDILHAHLYFPGLYAGLLGVADRTTIFETFHNLAYAGANQNGAKLKFRKALRALIAKRSSARFLGVSDAVAGHYAAALDIPKVDVLPNPIDLDAIGSAAVTASKKRDPSAPLKLVVPGRLVPEKGHGNLLAALAEAKMPSFGLEFLGGGPLEAALREQASNLSVPVKISGTIPHDQFLSAIAAADICVVPSRHEGFGIAAAEAMALGIPVIATDVGGLPEVIGDAGVIVPAGDAQALLNAVQSLAADPAARNRLGKAGAAQSKKRWAVQGIAAKLASFYREDV